MLKYVYVNQEDKGLYQFEIIINVLVDALQNVVHKQNSSILEALSKESKNEYHKKAHAFFLIIKSRLSLTARESTLDVRIRRQILTPKVDQRNARVKYV